MGRPDAACSEFVIVQNMEKGEKECLIYLPVYKELKSLSVGVDSGFRVLASADPVAKKKVLIY